MKANNKEDFQSRKCAVALIASQGTKAQALLMPTPREISDKSKGFELSDIF
jgi:hypothetical protein